MAGFARFLVVVALLCCGYARQLESQRSKHRSHRRGHSHHKVFLKHVSATDGVKGNVASFNGQKTDVSSDESDDEDDDKDQSDDDFDQKDASDDQESDADDQDDSDEEQDDDDGESPDTTNATTTALPSTRPLPTKAEKDLEKAIAERKVLRNKLGAFGNDAAFDAEVAEDERQVAEETHAVALAQFLGRMWKEMRMFASPFYKEHLRAELKLADAKVAALQKEVKTGVKQAEPTASPEETTPAPEKKQEEEKEKDEEPEKKGKKEEEEDEKDKPAKADKGKKKQEPEPEKKKPEPKPEEPSGWPILIVLLLCVACSAGIFFIGCRPH